MTVDIGLSPASAFDVNLLGGVKLKKSGKNKMTVTRELSTVDDYAVDQKQQKLHHKQQQSETAEEPKGNPDRAVMSSATSGPAASSAGSTTASSPSSQAASRPKFMITDILRNDSGPAVSVNSSVYNPSAAAQQQQQQPQQHPPGLPSHHHPFYQFNLAAAAAAAAAYGFNPAGMMPGMMPPLHQFLVGHHQSQHHPHHHPQMGPVGMMPSGMMGGAPNSAESSPRDLSFKRSAAAANFASEPNEDDEDEFVDPDGSDHDRDSPIGKADLMLSDDESDICKF